MITTHQVGNQPPNPEVIQAANRVQQIMQPRCTDEIKAISSGKSEKAFIDLVATMKDQGLVPRDWPEPRLRLNKVAEPQPGQPDALIAPLDFHTSVLITALQISEEKDGKLTYMPSSSDALAFGLWHVDQGVMWTWEYDQKRLRALIGPAYNQAVEMLDNLNNVHTGNSGDAEIAYASLFVGLWRAVGELDAQTATKVGNRAVELSGLTQERAANLSQDARLSALNGLLARTPAFRVTRVVGHVQRDQGNGRIGTDTFFTCVLHGNQELEDNPDLFPDVLEKVVTDGDQQPLIGDMICIPDTSNAFSIYRELTQWDRIPVHGWHASPAAAAILEGWADAVFKDEDPPKAEEVDKWAEQKKKQKVGLPGIQQDAPAEA